MRFKCIYCEKEFNKPPSAKRKYCSMECRNKAYKFRKNVLECMWCGEDVKQHRARRKMFCSKECRDSHVKQRSLEKHRKYCKFCSSVFWPLKHPQQKYCSVTCMNRAKFN